MENVILYNEFHIDFSRSYEEQADSLNEDLFQMDLGDGRLLDIGWYPEFDPNGYFRVQVIHNGNWNSPECNISGHVVIQHTATIQPISKFDSASAEAVPSALQRR